jgi:hypothetical protein
MSRILFAEQTFPMLRIPDCERDKQTSHWKCESRGHGFVILSLWKFHNEKIY